MMATNKDHAKAGQVMLACCLPGGRAVSLHRLDLFTPALPACKQCIAAHASPARDGAGGSSVHSTSRNQRNYTQRGKDDLAAHI